MKKILIIEDDPLIAEVYGSKYSTAGFDTRVAPDGEVGLQLLKTFKPDLVHLDLGMPKVNGVDIIRHIRSQPELKSLPVIVLSNTYQNRLVKGAIEAGATECVSKAACTPKMMLAIVERALSRMEAAPTPLESAPPPESAAAEPVGASEAPAPSVPEAPPPPPSSGTVEIRKHAAFIDEFRGDFAKRAPQMLSALRQRLEPLLRAEAEDERVPQLSDLCRVARSLAGHAGIAGIQDLAQMANALEAFLRDLIEKPNDLTPSALRTIVDACDFLGVLSERPGHEASEAAAPPIVLVVDDEVISRRAVCLALARLNVPTVSVDDPQIALRLLAENSFALVFLDVEMPGLRGFDLCRELRTLPAHRTTPVVFVTSGDGIQDRENAIACGGNDLIAKPFLPMELAVKALSLLSV